MKNAKKTAARRPVYHLNPAAPDPFHYLNRGEQMNYQGALDWPDGQQAMITTLWVKVNDRDALKFQDSMPVVEFGSVLEVDLVISADEDEEGKPTNGVILGYILPNGASYWKKVSNRFNAFRMGARLHREATKDNPLKLSTCSKWDKSW